MVSENGLAACAVGLSTAMALCAHWPAGVTVWPKAKAGTEAAPIIANAASAARTFLLVALAWLAPVAWLCLFIGPPFEVELARRRPGAPGNPEGKAGRRERERSGAPGHNENAPPL